MRYTHFLQAVDPTQTLKPSQYACMTSHFHHNPDLTLTQILILIKPYP